MPSGKKRKRHKMSTHKRKKRLRKNRHKKKKQFFRTFSFDYQNLKEPENSFRFLFITRICNGDGSNLSDHRTKE